MRFIFILFLLACVSSTVLARTMEDQDVAVLRTIDKLSARNKTFEIPVDKTVQFGKSLFIQVRACRKASPLDKPESAAFLQIWEKQPTDTESHWVFSGWMFSSSPAQSALDHPIYDVWVIDCKSSATSAKEDAFSSEKAPVDAPDAEALPPPGKKDEPEELLKEDAEAAPAPPTTEQPPVEQRPASPMPPLEQLPGSFENGGE